MDRSVYMVKRIELSVVLFCFILSCNQAATREGTCCETEGEGPLSSELNDAVRQSAHEARRDYNSQWQRYNDWVGLLAGAMVSLQLQVDRNGDNEIDLQYLQSVLSEAVTAQDALPSLPEAMRAVNAGAVVLEAYRTFLLQLERGERTGDAFFVSYQGVVDSYNHWVAQTADVRSRLLGVDEPALR